MLVWIFFLLAVMLYMLTYKVEKLHPGASIGLSAASLGFALASVMKSFPNGDRVTGTVSPPSTPPSTSPPGNLKFNAFKNMAQDDEAAWCVGTSYAIAFTVGNGTSEVGPSTDEIKSTTHTQPVFTLEYTPPSGTVQWYRAVEGVAEGELQPHEMQTDVVDGVVYYIDTDNPCTEPYRPDPPPVPLLGGGQFGENQQWEIKAGQGLIPWCKRTVYYASYVKAGTNANESDLSEPSVLFSSKEFSNPCLSVPAPRAGYEVNWYRQNLEAVSNITLPLFQRNGPKKNGFILLRYATGLNIFPTQDETKLLDFEDLWEDGSPTVTVPVSLFVERWNRALPPRIPGEQRSGELSILEDGRLAMNRIDTPVTLPISINGESVPWWTAMGFSTGNLTTNQDLIAVTPPLSGVEGLGDAQTDLEFVGKGTQLIDRNNPCSNPNAPNAGPAFRNWRKEF